MSAPREQKKSDWLSPSAIFGVLGFAGMVLTSMSQFRENSATAIADLKARVIHLEKDVERLERAR